MWGWEMYLKLSEKLKGRDNLGDLDVDGKMLLKWILEKCYVKVY
jgi:hypothetical protein